ncbi:hypothetical protein BDC45DRAFT_529041 [Circinella umbellata]|nr:hypothetical protein BDC45DRAFT_529041 [Circinella umbellata]
MGKKIKARLVLQISKALRKKAHVYLSSLMYAKDPEEFDVHFHTNNLIESWHNQLKTHYLKNKKT